MVKIERLCYYFGVDIKLKINPPVAEGSEGMTQENNQETNNKKRGAPKGNQNARKHGFYSKVLDETEQRNFDRATRIEGIDEEIALLRVKIISLLERDPENLKLIMQATNTLARLVRTRFNIGKEDRKGLKEAISTVLKDVALPLGISIGANLAK